MVEGWKKFCINTLLGFTPLPEDKPTNAIHADSTGVYSSEKNSHLSKV